jgi:hypothetical protein
VARVPLELLEEAYEGRHERARRLRVAAYGGGRGLRFAGRLPAMGSSAYRVRPRFHPVPPLAAVQIGPSRSTIRGEGRKVEGGGNNGGRCACRLSQRAEPAQEDGCCNAAAALGHMPGLAKPMHPGCCCPIAFLTQQSTCRQALASKALAAVPTLWRFTAGAAGSGARRTAYRATCEWSSEPCSRAVAHRDRPDGRLGCYFGAYRGDKFKSLLASRRCGRTKINDPARNEIQDIDLAPYTC